VDRLLAGSMKGGAGEGAKAAPAEPHLSVGETSLPV
jgi:hypothetical protein